ncbi:MAG: hypothetical protein RI983_1608 [Bacteroidota bacterium]|jgi:uncharacterized protein (DUF779 family)
MYPRVEITKAASDLIFVLKEKYGELMFHQSGGCCDGSQPMCFEKGEFRIGSSDIKIGTIENCEFFMSKDQYEYWKHTHLTIDVIPGRGSSFSLEIPLGFRFIVKSRLFSEEELQNLEPVIYFN